eukprot:scaffold19479_cov111-Isochrysis_galbana.AAC.3
MPRRPGCSVAGASSPALTSRPRHDRWLRNSAPVRANVRAPPAAASRPAGARAPPPVSRRAGARAPPPVSCRAAAARLAWQPEAPMSRPDRSECSGGKSSSDPPPPPVSKPPP